MNTNPSPTRRYTMKAVLSETARSTDSHLVKCRPSTRTQHTTLHVHTRTYTTDPVVKTTTKLRSVFSLLPHTWTKSGRKVISQFPKSVCVFSRICENHVNTRAHAIASDCTRGLRPRTALISNPLHVSRRSAQKASRRRTVQMVNFS